MLLNGSVCRHNVFCAITVVLVDFLQTDHLYGYYWYKCTWNFWNWHLLGTFSHGYLGNRTKYRQNYHQLRAQSIQSNNKNAWKLDEIFFNLLFKIKWIKNFMYICTSNNHKDDQSAKNQLELQLSHRKHCVYRCEMIIVLGLLMAYKNI
jgi:hypothetical protein